VPDGTLIKLPNGYFNKKTKDGWKLVQRAVMEEYLGRPLDPTERVYFVNQDVDKSDPKPEDLYIKIIKLKEHDTDEAKIQRIRELRTEMEDLLKELPA
jgi:hypothetical protein